MSGSYKIAVVARQSFLQLTFVGLWDEVVMNAFERDLDRERDKMVRQGFSADWSRIVIDMREFDVQPQEITRRLQSRVAKNHAERRIAFIMPGSQLQKLQIGRVAAEEQHRFFSSQAEARAWLGTGLVPVPKRAAVPA